MAAFPSKRRLIAPSAHTSTSSQKTGACSRRGRSDLYSTTRAASFRSVRSHRRQVHLRRRCLRQGLRLQHLRLCRRHHRTHCPHLELKHVAHSLIATHTHGVCRFPPGTVLPPFGPNISPPGSPSGVTLSSESIVLVSTAILAAASFGMISYFVCCFRRSVRDAVGTTFKRTSNGAGLGESVPHARIAPDGTSSVVHGVLVSESGSGKAGTRVNRKDKRVNGERDHLLAEIGGF